MTGIAVARPENRDFGHLGRGCSTDAASNGSDNLLLRYAVG
jgi:hypothetical protein